MQTSNRASSHADGQEADACHLICMAVGLWDLPDKSHRQARSGMVGPSPGPARARTHAK